MEATRPAVLREYRAPTGDLYYHYTRSPKTGARYHNNSKAHRQYEILLLLEGEITYVIEGERYQVRAGDMIFVSPGEIHALEIDGRYPYERAVLLFDIRALARMMEELQVSLPAFTDNGKSRLRIVKRPDVSAFGLDRLLMDVVCREENEPYRQLMILARLVELAVGVDKLMANHPRTLPEPDKHNQLVADVVAYIDSHLSESLRLEALAEHFYVSTSTLCHKFSAEMHISPARYITLKRMYHAARLLREGYSATEAARMAGYENYVSFFYNYKKLMGVSPTGEPERERQ